MLILDPLTRCSGSESTQSRMDKLKQIESFVSVATEAA